ncbi:hypothetical protein G6F60_014681 [Rhizopus arrhizus]|nr:hypothetical protein G6F60_014681 [Rhizopus arrhizus]
MHCACRQAGHAAARRTDGGPRPAGHRPAAAVLRRGAQDRRPAAGLGQGLRRRDRAWTDHRYRRFRRPGAAAAPGAGSQRAGPAGRAGAADRQHPAAGADLFGAEAGR